MKTEEKNSSPKVRIAVLGNMNVGKSGELKISFVRKFMSFSTEKQKSRNVVEITNN